MGKETHERTKQQLQASEKANPLLRLREQPPRKEQPRKKLSQEEPPQPLPHHQQDPPWGTGSGAVLSTLLKEPQGGTHLTPQIRQESLPSSLLSACGSLISSFFKSRTLQGKFLKIKKKKGHSDKSQMWDSLQNNFARSAVLYGKRLKEMRQSSTVNGH